MPTLFRLQCVSGGWHIGGSEGLFGPGSGLFAGVRFCDVSVGLAMCEWWLSHWGLFGCSLVWVVGGSGLFAGVRFCDVSAGPLCVSVGWHIAASVVILIVMCKRWLAHWGLCGGLGWWWGSGSGCFLRLFVFGSVGGLAMCEWWLSHWGLFGCSLVWVVGGSGLFAGFWRPGVFLWGRYVQVVAGTLGGLRGCLVRGAACLLGSGFVMCLPGRYV